MPVLHSIPKSDFMHGMELTVRLEVLQDMGGGPRRRVVHLPSGLEEEVFVNIFDVPAGCRYALRTIIAEKVKDAYMRIVGLYDMKDFIISIEKQYRRRCALMNK